jgi:hypothetical protein
LLHGTIQLIVIMTSYVLFAVFWLVIIYGLNCLIAKKVKKVDIKQALSLRNYGCDGWSV